MNILLKHCFTFINGLQKLIQGYICGQHLTGPLSPSSISLDLCHPGQPNDQEQQHSRLNPNTHLLHYNGCLLYGTNYMLYYNTHLLHYNSCLLYCTNYLLYYNTHLLY